jgi:hypothetical protein
VDVTVAAGFALDAAAVADVDVTVARARALYQAILVALEGAVAGACTLQVAVGGALDVTVARRRAHAVVALAHAVPVLAVGVDVVLRTTWHHGGETAEDQPQEDRGQKSSVHAPLDHAETCGSRLDAC